MFNRIAFHVVVFLFTYIGMGFSSFILSGFIGDTWATLISVVAGLWVGWNFPPVCCTTKELSNV